MWRGYVIEQSLDDAGFLDGTTQDVRSWPDDPDAWRIRVLAVPDTDIETVVSKTMEHLNADQPWYAHFWNDSRLKVVFKDRDFEAGADPADWSEIISHGKELAVPKAQLDFEPRDQEQHEDFLKKTYSVVSKH